MDIRVESNRVEFTNIQNDVHVNDEDIEDILFIYLKSPAHPIPPKKKYVTVISGLKMISTAHHRQSSVFNEGIDMQVILSSDLIFELKM